MALRRFPLLLAVLALIAAVLPVERSAAKSDLIPDHYIVVFKDTVRDPAGKAQALGVQHGLAVKHTYRAALNGFAAVVPPARLAAVQADPDVAFIQQDRRISIAGQNLPSGVNRIEGDLSSTQSGNGAGSVNVAVAILDTGIDKRHRDLNVVGGKDCTGGANYSDLHGHGTHVAGTVAAKDDGNGVVGMAPGAPLYAVRVLGQDGSGQWSWVICGVDWVTANAASTGIKVANMNRVSFESGCRCSPHRCPQCVCISSTRAIIAYRSENDCTACAGKVERVGAECTPVTTGGTTTVRSCWVGGQKSWCG